jgi:hypothetical protein
MCWNDGASGYALYIKLGEADLDLAGVCHYGFDVHGVHKRFPEGDALDARVVESVHVVPNYKTSPPVDQYHVDLP